MKSNLVIGRCTHIFYGQNGPFDPYFAHELSLRESNKHKVIVYTWNKNRERPRTEKVNSNYCIYWLDGLNLALKPLFQDYPYLVKLSEAISGNSHDLFHAISHLFLPAFASIRKAKSLHIPSIVSVHGVLAQRDPFTNFLQYSYMLSLGSYVRDKSTIVHCVTKSDADLMINLGCKPEKIVVLPNPVDTEVFQPGYLARSNQIIWAGRFVPEKGLEYLIQAFRLVLNYKKEVRLVLVGDGPEKPKIVALVNSLGLQKNVFFEVPLDSRGIASQLSESALFVLPSVREGFPRILLEAMSCAKPVVAFKIPGIKEIVKNDYNGILVKLRDAKSLAKAILELLEDNDRARHLSSNARETIVEHHTWDKYLAKLDRVYEMALSMNR